MLRCNLISAHRRNSYYQYKLSFISSIAVSVEPSQITLPVGSQNRKPPIYPSSPYLIPLQTLVDQYKTIQTHLKTQPSLAYFSPSTSDKYDFLVQRYQFSCLDGDAKQLHLQIVKTGFANDLFLSNTLINLYVRTGDLVSAHSLFDEMPSRNSVTWACLISGYSHNDLPHEACLFFREMIRDGFVPNHYAIGSALRGCQVLRLSGLAVGIQIHGFVSKTQYIFDAVVCNVLISMYGNCMNSAEYARRVFDAIMIKSSVSWNSMISVYSQRGDAYSGFRLFSSMKQEGSGFIIKPTAHTFGSLIAVASSSSVESKLCLLEQILAEIEKTGFIKDLFVGSALVSGFSKVGLLDTAKKIFEQMGVRNAVSMNGLMVGLVRQKQGEAAAAVFSKTKCSVELNPDSYMVLLSAFPEYSVLQEGIRKGREVHAHVITTGLIESKVAIGNSVMNMYFKCSEIDDARSVFRLIMDKDSVSWNSLIAGLDQNECFEEAIMGFRIMRRNWFIPSNFALISGLSSCGSLGWIRMGTQIHCEALKFGLDIDVSVSNALLALYAETKSSTECKKVFSLMQNHDQVSWNTVIGAFADSEESISEAVGYFIQMMRTGWSLNRVTFMNILVAVSSLSLHEFGCQIHALALKHKEIDDSAIENALIACYGKCGKINECEKIFWRMHDRRDDISWNSMISGYIHNEFLHKAMNLVWLMLENGNKLDRFTLATVLSACASVSTLERGMEVHARSVRACLESDVVVGSALVDMYAKCGRIDYASCFFELLPEKNVYSWNSMISGYARHGQGEKALEVFTRMKLEGQLLDHVTFVGVLSACSHVGLVEKGFEYFESMSKVYGLIPQIEHFSCMVDLLGRAGQLDQVEDFIDGMPIKPNVLIWRTILGACGRGNGRRTDLGQRAAKMLMELEPQNAVNYVLLCNMYASGGNWEDLAKARALMREAEAKKEAGCSWVTMKDGVHVFVAGDKSHPEIVEINRKLDEIQRKIKEVGYIPQVRFAMYDLEVENKEESLSYHSEKLAVAFVLTRESEMPIRIMKNLRVCGDCHSAFKFISQVFGRKIVLRDSNRFHHFIDGKCSCNDYW